MSAAEHVGERTPTLGWVVPLITTIAAGIAGGGGRLPIALSTLVCTVTMKVSQIRQHAVAKNQRQLQRTSGR